MLTVVILRCRVYDRSPLRNTVPRHAFHQCAGRVDSFLHHRVYVVTTLLKQSALLQAQGRENRTKCVSTVPTTVFCLQREFKCC